MEKLKLLFLLPLLLLTGCKDKEYKAQVYGTGTITLDVETYGVVYCTLDDPCEYCAFFAGESMGQLDNAISITCTHIGEGHEHYCITYIRK